MVVNDGNEAKEGGFNDCEHGDSPPTSYRPVTSSHSEIGVTISGREAMAWWVSMARAMQLMVSRTNGSQGGNDGNPVG